MFQLLDFFPWMSFLLQDQQTFSMNTVCLRSPCAFDEYSQVPWLRFIYSRDSEYPLFSFHSNWGIISGCGDQDFY